MILNLQILILILHLGCSVAQRKNVLFIMSDDMRPSLGVYSGPDAPSSSDPPMHTPNLDALADRSLLLKRAYVQQAICVPSRTSFLTGRRPETTRVSDMYQHWRTVGGNFTTIPQHFKENGYNTISIGKIFHPGHASNNDDPISWSEIIKPNNSHWSDRDSISWYAADVQETKDYPLVDMQTATYAIETLERVAPQALSGEQPFFIGVGFQKPHLPFMCPANFFDYYPEDEIVLPDNPYASLDMPPIAWATYEEIRRYDDIGNQYGYGCFNTTLPDNKTKELRRAYFASISYIDSLVGDVIQALDDLGLSNNTVISFIGDHGLQLGEHGEWCKHTNFELSTHTPMMVSVPGLTDESVVTEQLTEFVDLFPTLAEAAGVPLLPMCPENSEDILLCTEGISMVPLMLDPERPWKSAAFSQYPRGTMSGGTVMGYRIRTSNYSYTEWVDYDPLLFTAISPITVDAKELYDHVLDPDENINRAGYPEYRLVEEELSVQLYEGWRNALPELSVNENNP